VIELQIPLKANLVFKNLLCDFTSYLHVDLFSTSKYCLKLVILCSASVKEQSPENLHELLEKIENWNNNSHEHCEIYIYKRDLLVGFS
jgi:hypothetical protein